MAEQRPILLSLYLAAAQALSPLFHILFWTRSRSGKEIPERKPERFGRSSIARPNGSLVWIHAASVGETTSALALIETLTAEGHTVLLTTVTVTASELAAKRLPDGAMHQFVPYDTPAPLKRFLDHWSPDLAMVVESEIWPCLFDELNRRAVPFVLLNGRLSDGSLRNWSRVPKTSRFIFDCLDMVLAQSQADAARFRKLGCKNVQVPGNLKFDASELAADEATLLQLKTQIGERAIWLAALTHPGEDEIVFDAFSQLLREMPDLILILVPRHPARAEEIRKEAETRGFSLVTRSSRNSITPETQVFLGDTLGEMGLYYRLAPVAFLGGSFIDVGGHNPVEAALAGSALVTGPKVANARAVYKDFWSGGAAVRVSEPSMLAGQIGVLLKDAGLARTQAQTAKTLVEAGRGALGKSRELLRPYLNKENLRQSSEASNEEGS